LIVHMIGNAHIDPVWLWSWQAGADEVLATFRSAADRCDEYPDFIFTAGEAWRYHVVEQLDAELFARIRKLVASGQWHVTGGQWVQPDCNLPTAEGMRRQLAAGADYFAERFGVRSEVGYNVDSFGHPATLPGILRQAGMSSYVFCRPNPEQVKLPANVFRWRGSDGAEVVAFRMFPTYVTREGNLREHLQLALDTAVTELGHTMCFYGIGNHGGGPTKTQVEWIRANPNPLPDVEIRFSTPAAFFEAVRAGVGSLPVVTDELQHVFPGCYSVMHDIKQEQRHGEHLLMQAERALELLDADAPDRDGSAAALRLAWRDLLFTQFHDILAGTSAPSAWPGVRAIQGRARATAEEVVHRSTRRWARRALPAVDEVRVVAINLDSEPWEGLVESEPWLESEDWGPRHLVSEDGQALPYQLVQPETPLGLTRLLWPARIPAGGAVEALIKDGPGAAASGEAATLDVSPTGMRNSRLALELTSTGVSSIAADGRELLRSPGLSLHLREDRGDTWVFKSDNLPGEVSARTEGLEWEVEERGPLRVRARAEGNLGNSAVRWTVDLNAGEAAVRLRLEINFFERHRSLQLLTPLASGPEGWLDGQPGGVVERVPGTSEWPVQGWSRVAVPGGHLAWITQDANSVCLDGRDWHWTLLRSPRMGWMGEDAGLHAGRNWYTDQGWHQFDMVLRFADELAPGELEREARQRAQAPVVFDRYEGLDRPPWGANPPPELEILPAAEG
jgi:alpha-mannosidase